MNNSESGKFIMMLETKRLLLRNITPADAEFLIDLWTDPDVTKYMGGPRNRKNMISDIKENIRNPYAEEFDLWILTDKATQHPVGHCGLLKKDVDGVAEVEVIYVIGKEFQGNGYATEIVNALISYAFYEKKCDNVIALIKPANTASQRVAINSGFELEKKIIRQNSPMLLFRKDKKNKG